jgi:hypothetical protein
MQTPEKKKYRPSLAKPAAQIKIALRTLKKYGSPEKFSKYTTCTKFFLFLAKRRSLTPDEDDEEDDEDGNYEQSSYVRASCYS